MVSLSDVNRDSVPYKRRRRVGRGIGSGYGKTASRGHNGAGSRSGNRRRRGYQGGQMPLFRRVAKRGFSNAAFASEIVVINVDQLEKRCEDGQELSLDVLRSVFSLSRKVEVKILGRGALSRKLIVHANAFSASAVEAISGAGGTVVRV
ncbi:MAG: 50S ribosomal protein L15 [Planctomycetota bacterium]|nr:50S ribosomal protein L15 [Planctomycetota bacterium]